jgi:hypothetical protein
MHEPAEFRSTQPAIGETRYVEVLGFEGDEPTAEDVARVADFLAAACPHHVAHVYSMTSWRNEPVIRVEWDLGDPADLPRGRKLRLTGWAPRFRFV